MANWGTSGRFSTEPPSAQASKKDADTDCSTGCAIHAPRLLLDHEVALDRVQVILGHRDIGMTRRYAETRPEALREAIAATFDR